MNGNNRPVGDNVATPKTAAEALHLKKLLQTGDMAWLRMLKDAQAKDQCRQL